MGNWDIARPPASMRLLTGLGVDHGLPPWVCLEGTGIRVEELRDPAATVTVRQELTVISNLLRALGDPPGLGLEAGVRYHLTTYGVWGFAVSSSRDWRSAIETGLRHLDLTFAVGRIHARERVGELRLVLDVPDLPRNVRRFVVECIGAAIRNIQDELFAVPMPVRSVGYAFPPPPSPSAAARYAGIFGVEPVFGAAENSVGIPAEILDLPLPQYDEFTATLARERCRALSADRRARTGLAVRVSDLLLTCTATAPRLERVAAALHMSERTLRRRLAEEGVSFRGLLDAVRERLAVELLVTAGLPVAEVARRLGYAELSSFSQAFRRWKGVGPREFRARQRETSGARNPATTAASSPFMVSSPR
ncbi:AraC family transcriptional regulator [Streptomyces sp. NPDC004267]|uniref:AraC family transcriptional regulator n=1 Tax=Streptomyces sp. NPDC004267 TaxID=3364694 RepID=UPI0036AE9967